MDAPIRVEEQDFNISAPHMHATMLEALDIQPGDRVLDVGCGCGFITACAAYLAGPSGRVLGVDIKPYCTRLSESNCRRLQQASAAFAAASALLAFETHNIFMPGGQYRGRYNKVHVGAACPEERVHLLLGLLPPEGGSLLVPVASDLRLYVRSASGATSARLVSSVRFSELEVPSDAAVALAMLQERQQQRLAVDVPPSTFAADMAAADAGNDQLPSPTAKARRLSPAGLCGGGCLADVCMHSDDQFGKRPPRQEQQQEQQQAAESAVVYEPGVACERFGEPDCWLQGSGWQLRAHKAVLRARCAHFQARLSSGMRDADGTTHSVPESFSCTATSALLTYLYSDRIEQLQLAPGTVAELLHVACFYGVPRLVELCEQRLAADLLALPPEAGAVEAAQVLALADDLGLEQLRRVAVAYIAHSYERARSGSAGVGVGNGGVNGNVGRDGCGAGGGGDKAGGDVQANVLGQLSQQQLELVCAELAGDLARLQLALKEVQPPGGAGAGGAGSVHRRHGMWW